MQCQYLIVLAFFFVHTLDPDTYDNAFSSIMSYIIPYYAPDIMSYIIRYNMSCRHYVIHNNLTFWQVGSRLGQGTIPNV